MTQQTRNKVAIRALMSAAALSAVRSGFPIRASGPNHVNTRTAALFSPPLLIARRVPKVSPVGAVDVRRIRVLRRCRRSSPCPWPLCCGRLRRRDWCGSGRRARGCLALLWEQMMPRNLRQVCSKRAAGAHPSLSRRSQAVQTQETCPAAGSVTCTAWDKTSQENGGPARAWGLHGAPPAWTSESCSGAESGLGLDWNALKVMLCTGPGVPLVFRSRPATPYFEVLP